VLLIYVMMRVLYLFKEAIRIYQTEGIRSFLYSLWKFIFYRLRPLYWVCYEKRFDSKCDYDTSKIVRIQVDPTSIRWAAKVDRNRIPVYGPHAVVGELSGSWDRLKIPIEHTSAHTQYKEAIRKDKKIELIETIKKEGYKTQKNLNEGTRIIGNRKLLDEPRLAVGRNNELMRWTGGNHRIAAARLLGIDEIPAYVVVWHPKSDKRDLNSLTSQGSPE